MGVFLRAVEAVVFRSKFYPMPGRFPSSTGGGRRTPCENERKLAPCRSGSPAVLPCDPLHPGGAIQREAQSRTHEMHERSIELNTNRDLLDTRTIVLNQGDPEEKREEIRRYFHQTWEIDEALIETLKYHETFYRRADPLRHPLIFYFGHTSVFFVNKLIIAKLIDRAGQRQVRIDVRHRCGRDVLGRPRHVPLRLACGGRGPGVPQHGAGAGGRADPEHAARHADRLGEPLLGDHDGHRARAHPPGDVLGADPAAADRRASRASALGDVSPVGRSARERADRGRAGKGPAREAEGSPPLRLGQRVRRARGRDR